MPLYFAGGFQGGKAKEWIKAMKVMKKIIDTDLNHKNYIPVWNDESVWNKYLSENTPSKVLSLFLIDSSLSSDRPLVLPF